MGAVVTTAVGNVGIDTSVSSYAIMYSIRNVSMKGRDSMFKLFGNTNKRILKSSAYYWQDSLKDIFNIIVDDVNTNHFVDYEIVAIDHRLDGVECIVKYYM